MRSTFAASILALATAVSAVGNSIVVNNGFDSIYLTSTGGSNSEIAVAAGSSWSEQIHQGGYAIKITKVAGGLWNGAPTQIVGITLDAVPRVWFSLDAVNGEPFAGQKLVLSSAGGTGDITWQTGNDIGDQVRDTNPESDVVFTINA